MIKKNVKELWHTEEMNNSIASSEIQAEFVLSYNKLIIGNLSINQGKWTFKYTEEFKKQSEILPLSNFPNKELVYSSTELWPFFASRIPGVAQLEKNEKVCLTDQSSRNEVDLLRKYGHRTITNPYILKPAI